MSTKRTFVYVVYYVNPQERKPQALRDWQDLLQGRAHNVHKVDVCALSLLWRENEGSAPCTALAVFLIWELLRKR